MEHELPDYVRDYKLETTFPKKREVVHIYDDPDAPPSSQRRLECWKRDKRPIGRGGQGQVFLQTCINGSRHYTHRAVKIIPLQDGGGRRRYIRELETIVKFSHDKYSKYFVKSLGWYENKDSLCIAMEYFPTGDLQTYLCDHPALPEDDSRQITSQVLRGLVIMHGEGFAHRDIKPQNVLIQQRPTPTEPGSWWVKLSDFGISKRLEAATSGASTVIGTVEYMAPELFDQDSLPDINYPAADMWALGVMTFWILTKSRVFSSQRHFFQYEARPDTLFPRGSLVDFHVSLDGQAFIRALMGPKPDERLDSKAAICHAWVQSWMPSAPMISDDRSE
ncbi:kinase-like domain-containing protein [Ilyonectria robusta]|uniref:kinase-like domain-containing protein n=1 Tax=Ilyonectria robusta TaxID=1079257 RepID=UPI001E8CE08E|nr:kinase-like domain-containing protein [Ilyonectria robusta]KAH8656798.1 kinase-like domain-containing protein [Ilyonectria robusta]